MLVEIGLCSAKHTVQDGGEPRVVTLEGLRVCSVHVPDGTKTSEALVTITHPHGVLANHSDDAPTWVECQDNPALASLLAEHYECAIGKPDDVEDTHYTANGAPKEA